jgi:guanosine-3',5'-bis(diphosphate) 3'-pyrophosphohydrolase
MNKSMVINKNDSNRIENAIHFLSKNYQETGFNEKPVVLHSIRIAFGLLDSGFECDIIITAILHDLIEDTKVTFANIKKNFGQEIAINVLSVSEDKNIMDYEDRYKEMFSRTVKRGKSAIIVKAADLYDNSFYISFEKDVKKQKMLIEKMKYFLEITKDINYTKLHQLLEKRYNEKLLRYKIIN